VSSKIVLALESVLSKVTVHKNNQNNADFITFLSSVIVLTAEPRMIISILINILKINADLRHLYLSVNTPITGRTNKPSTVKIKPTMTGEYPFASHC